MKQTLYIPLVLVFGLVSGCGPSEQADSTVEIASESKEDQNSAILETTETIFYSMPSPMELTMLIKSAGGEYNGVLLHDPNKASQYQTTEKRALALGVYGSDMSYSMVYNRQSEAVKYLAACKRLGESIGIHEAFSAELIEKANANLSNRDSMLAIMTEMYWQTNSQLQEENRDQIALMVMASGWVEGLHIGSNLMDDNTEGFDVVQRMAEQKFASQQIEDMFLALEGDPLVAGIADMFQPLFDLFNSLEMTNSETSISKDESSGVHSIGGKVEIDLSQENLEKLKSIVADLRAKIIEQ